MSSNAVRVDIPQDNFNAYVDLYANIAPERLAEFHDICTPDMYFRDPFNEVRGVDKLIYLLDHMFQATEAPTFKINHRVFGEKVGFVSWQFSARILKGGIDLDFPGTSELHLADDGRVCANIDYWDVSAHVFEKIPFVGAPIRGLRQFMAVKI